MEPGVARMQAVRLSPEIRILVVNGYPSSKREEKADALQPVQGSSLKWVMAMHLRHHRGLRTGHTFKRVDRELGRASCLLAIDSR